MKRRWDTSELHTTLAITLLIAGAVALVLSMPPGCAAAAPRAEISDLRFETPASQPAVQQVTGQLAVALGKLVELNAQTRNQVAALNSKIDESTTTNVVWPYVLIVAFVIGGGVLMYWIKVHSYLRQKPQYEAARCKHQIEDAQ